MWQVKYSVTVSLDEATACFLTKTYQEEIIIFDATGTALQDVAAAVAVYEKAVKQGVGTSIDFFQ